MAPQDCRPLLEELNSIAVEAAEADRKTIALAREMKQRGDLPVAFQLMLGSVEKMRDDVMRRLDLLERIKAEIS